MSDREVPGRHNESSADRANARDKLRRQLEDMRSAEADPSSGNRTPKVTRLPRRPRRVTDDLRGAPDPQGGPVYDPAPTRPVSRSELQHETGRWPAGPTPKKPPTAPPQGNVVDLDALRRRRGGDDPRPTKARRITKKDERPAPTEDTPTPDDPANPN
ncbi:hypothetical protein [Nocardia bovistercoris]|uniref:Uncharacterized protein n=1 Tax=Nocardia bovistercoris TaxID=2785916 RepID=A0A931IFL3_9NOCA|nr:hypothetical protein [Nocardia bovistercoris]MBH0779177.1 hypothetical protein [Nocardia bovistercoris]